MLLVCCGVVLLRCVFMCCSDVSARGMDYPDVTRVIQVSYTIVLNTVHTLYTVTNCNTLLLLVLA
jgi:hypothetical protein